MKKINDYRKVLEVTKASTLQELKTAYRNAMKAYHPDKFHDEHEQKGEMEEKSKGIIEAYHFLVSITPETKAAGLLEYLKTTTLSGVPKFSYEDQTLSVEFADGSAYEYFDVPKLMYSKLINADSQGRFARRHIYNEFLYRSTKSKV